MSQLPAPPPTTVYGPACDTRRGPPWRRLAITFGVLFALKWGMPYLDLSPDVQVLVLLVTATALVWYFWWNRGLGRAPVLLMVGSLWIAGLVKIAVQ